MRPQWLLKEREGVHEVVLRTEDTFAFGKLWPHLIKKPPVASNASPDFIPNSESIKLSRIMYVYDHVAL